MKEKPPIWLQAWRADRKRLDNLRYPRSKCKGAECKKRRCVVSTEYFTAGATFKKLYGVWSCVAADTVLRWMVGKSLDFIEVSLLKMGAHWDWPSDSQRPANSVRPRTTVQGSPSLETDATKSELLNNDTKRLTLPSERAGERHCDIRGGVSLQTDRSTTRLTKDSVGPADPRLVNDAVVPTTGRAA